MNKNEATKILNLNKIDSIKSEDVENSYKKMIRRYPPENFPQKFEQISQAYKLLSNNDSFWTDFIQTEKLDFSFLTNYSNQKNNKLKKINEKLSKPLSQKELLTKIKPAFTRDFELEMFERFKLLFEDHIS
ncbi:MAG: hypothetical protein COB02_00530 [Candidatus Cloacimonadota bacterium]|nr:MAG: hypothetical protein COB02_00530 [Candidatus Cloacimonadota bacterium]